MQHVERWLTNQRRVIGEGLFFGTTECACFDVTNERSRDASRGDGEPVRKAEPRQEDDDASQWITVFAR